MREIREGHPMLIKLTVHISNFLSSSSTMASSRSRRSNAGSKMASLLNEEEKEATAGKDEFYETKYGGFLEEKDDGDFAYQSPGEEDDRVDSDFSIDEDDEVRSDIEDEGSGKRKTAKRGEGVQTKAYKGRKFLSRFIRCI